ncbi:MAG: hypothetical protein ACJ8G2_02805 [Burkholderiales bacterium]|jgi:hypothetical protein
MQQFTGKYLRKKGKQKNYDYTVTVSPNAGLWSATVRCDGQLTGMPSGTLTSIVAAEAEMRVRSVLEACIEGLEGVVE